MGMECQPAQGSQRGTSLEAAQQELPTERRPLPRAAHPQPGAPSPVLPQPHPMPGAGGSGREPALDLQPRSLCSWVAPDVTTEQARGIAEPPPGPHLPQDQGAAGDSALSLRTDPSPNSHAGLRPSVVCGKGSVARPGEGALRWAARVEGGLQRVPPTQPRDLKMHHALRPPGPAALGSQGLVGLP